MNKKRLGLFIFVVFLISIISLVFSALGDIEGRVDDFEDTADIIGDEDARTDYLKKEWTKFLEKSFGEVPKKRK